MKKDILPKGCRMEVESADAVVGVCDPAGGLGTDSRD